LAVSVDTTETDRTATVIARARTTDEYPVTGQAYTLAEEVANVGTHALGAILSLVATTVLVELALSAGAVAGAACVGVYGATLVLAYLSSTLYHSVRDPHAKRMFKICDHASIFLLIAGTYTPFTILTLGGGWGWSLFCLVWALALAGIIFKVMRIDGAEAASIALYLGLGWIGLVAAAPIAHSLAAGGIAWLLAGGILYSGGVVFYVWESLPFNHAIWHLFVLAGSTCHFLAILLYVVPAVA
jgi:hemolysin III